MKRHLTKLIVVILSLFCLLLPTPVLAKSSLQGYTIDVSSLNSSLSKYITSLNYEEQQDGSYSLYINNTYVGSKSGDPCAFAYYPNASTTISISISASKQTINFSMSQKQEEIYNSAFVFTLDKDGNQTLSFYPSANSTSGVQTKTVKGSSGIFDFGSFTTTLGSTSVTFFVSLNANNNTATITKNSSSKTYNVTKSIVTRTLYFENFVEGHPLDMNYMEKNLTKQTFANAKTIDYSDADVDAAVQNETLTLINSTTNKTYTVPLRRTITYWKRESGSSAGTGEYGESGSEVQVVCEWHDSACSSIRSKYGESGRLFAVYGSSSTYPTVASYDLTTYEYPTEYQNWSWPSDSWSSIRDAYPSSAIGTYGVAQYRSRTKALGDYSAWGEEPINCGSFCAYMDIQSQRFYAYRTRDWNSWSDYVYDSCTTNDTELIQCESTTMYRQATRSWSAWTAWSTSNKCGALSGSNCEEESRVRYAYRTRPYTAASVGSWSAWSDYAYALLGCSEKTQGGYATKECRSTTAYAYRKIGSWSDFSSYSTTVCSAEYDGANNTKVTDCLSRNEYRTATRSNQYKSCANSACGVASYSYSSYTYTYGSKPSPAYNCSSSTVTSSSCGTKTQYSASCSCLKPTSNTKTCTGAYGDTKTPCTISGCTSRRCSYNSKSVNLSCTRYYCATARTANYNSCRTSGCGEEAFGSWSSWSTNGCEASTNVKCESRKTYAKRTRSWGGYDSYTTDTAYLSNASYDYKTQTWYSSRTRSYTADSVGDWSSYTSYTYSTCENESEGVYVTKQCDSQTQYHYRTLGEYSAWSGYNVKYGSSEWANCSTSNLCKQEGATKYRTRNRTAWSQWTSYVYSSCSDVTSGTTLKQCDSKLKYRSASYVYGDWSSWIRTTSAKGVSGYEYQYRYNNGAGSWDLEKGTSSTLGLGTYYTGNSRTSSTSKAVTRTYATKSNKTIGSLAEMTASQITSKTNEITDALMMSNAYTSIKSGDSLLLYQDVMDYKNKTSELSSQAKEDALRYFEEKTIFIPYLYITSHWRAVSGQAEVSGYDNQTLTSVTTTQTTKEYSQGLNLLAYDIDLTKDTKIIYFDYRDPLINYKDELPENWQGYQELIRQLQNSDLTTYKIEIEMSKSDLLAMKEYLKTHNYKSNNCEMLREFAYIFKTTDSELAKFLSTGKGCVIESD